MYLSAQIFTRLNLSITNPGENRICLQLTLTLALLAKSEICTNPSLFELTLVPRQPNSVHFTHSRQQVSSLTNPKTGEFGGFTNRGAHAASGLKN